MLDDLDWFKQRNIGVINASPLALGLLNNDANWPEWHIAPKITKDVCKKAAQFCKDNDADLGTFFPLTITLLLFFACRVKKHTCHLIGIARPLVSPQKKIKLTAEQPSDFTFFKLRLIYLTFIVSDGLGSVHLGFSILKRP